LKRAWTKFSLCTSAAVALALFPATTFRGQSEKPKRVNEVTIAGLRPGRDALAAALKRFKAKYATSEAGASTRQWGDGCTGRALLVQVDDHSVIQEITVTSLVPQDGKCENRRFDALNMRDWTTGQGLRLGDPRDRVTELYGEPNTSGPSLRGSRELEFLYYAFDWAGPDVPQVMEVYCARETGRVVEIMLARPSL
jgi:hypothetical protein